ncbi:hypothetical protein ACHAPX_010301 [Trichoderma viride]
MVGCKSDRLNAEAMEGIEHTVDTPLAPQVPKRRRSSRLSPTDVEPNGDTAVKSSVSPPPKRLYTTALSPLSPESVVNDTIDVPFVPPVNKLGHSSSDKASIEIDERLFSSSPNHDGSPLLTPISAPGSQDPDYEEDLESSQSSDESDFINDENVPVVTTPVVLSPVVQAELKKQGFDPEIFTSPETDWLELLIRHPRISPGTAEDMRRFITQ